MLQEPTELSQPFPHETGVLLIEDNPGDALLAQEMLKDIESRPIACTHMQNLHAALDCLKTEKFDVILLDSELPDSRGHEGISRIKAENPEVAIIMLTGNSNLDFVTDSVRFGVEDYLVKGEFDRLRLEQAIEQGVERKRLEMRTHRYPIYDPLTRLAMRNLLTDRWHGTAARAKRSGTGVALAFIDLDNFKTINDTLGHAAGDAVLQTIATRLSDSVRESDSVVRYGGGEFLILLNDLESEKPAQRVVDKIRKCVPEPINLNGRAIICDCSIGIGYSAKPWETSLETLIEVADDRMYRDKKGRKGQIS